MIAIYHVFWMFVLIFAVIGAMRGWAKEMLVMFSVLTAIALNYLLERFAKDYMIFMQDPTSTTLFWFRFAILMILVFFGYQTVNISKFAPRVRREKIQDSVLGFVFGAVNGYGIVGTVWFYIYETEYALRFIYPPPPELYDVVDKIDRMLALMPPNLIGDPGIYFAVILALVFVLAVFL